MKSGFIIIDKPKGAASFSVITRLRKITGIKRIGFAGTLDPLATGILICAIGRESTKKISDFSKAPKRYIATLELGKKSDTYDLDGVVFKTKSAEKPTRKKIVENLKKFLGKIEQTPPIFSAKKINGQRAYALARRGEKFVLPKSEVEIFDIKIINYKYPKLILNIQCSAGTYIRSIANDLGDLLGTGALIVDLKRMEVGDIKIENAVKLEKINETNWEKYLI